MATDPGSALVESAVLSRLADDELVRHANGWFAAVVCVVNVLVHAFVLRVLFQHLRRRRKWSSLRISRKQTKRELLSRTDGSAQNGRFRRQSLLRATGMTSMFATSGSRSSSRNEGLSEQVWTQAEKSPPT